MVGHNTHAIYYTDDEEMEVIKEYLRLTKEIQRLAHEWVDEPDSLRGVTLLERMRQQTDYLWDLVDHESSDHRETLRITEPVRFFQGMLQRARNGREMDLGFEEGRTAEQKLDEIDTLVEEREQILEYAEQQS